MTAVDIGSVLTHSIVSRRFHAVHSLALKEGRINIPPAYEFPFENRFLTIPGRSVIFHVSLDRQRRHPAPTFSDRTAPSSFVCHAGTLASVSFFGDIGGLKGRRWRTTSRPMTSPQTANRPPLIHHLACHPLLLGRNA
jgi:hypothetical protein